MSVTPPESCASEQQPPIHWTDTSTPPASPVSSTGSAESDSESTVPLGYVPYASSVANDEDSVEEAMREALRVALWLPAMRMDSRVELRTPSFQALLRYVQFIRTVLNRHNPACFAFCEPWDIQWSKYDKLETSSLCRYR